MHENSANAMQTHDFGSLWTCRRGSQMTASALAGVQAKDRSGNLRGATDS